MRTSPRFNRRHSVTSFSYSDIFPSPNAHHDSNNKERDSLKSTITCRLCEGEIPIEMMGEHTRWCKDFQSCSLKKTTYDAFMRRIVEDLHMYPFPDRVDQKKALAERFAELMPKDVDKYDFSLATDSGLDSTPGRYGGATPIGTLSSLFTGLWQQSPRQ